MWGACSGPVAVYDRVMERILMHICCAPDATVPVLRLRAKGYEPVGFFYDPNIHPQEEYELRLAQARKLADIQQFELLEGPYEPDVWYAAAAPYKDEPEGGLRCRVCFGVVLDAAARTAAQLGIGRLFTTTLLTQPTQGRACPRGSGAGVWRALWSHVPSRGIPQAGRLPAVRAPQQGVWVVPAELLRLYLLEARIGTLARRPSPGQLLVAGPGRHNSTRNGLNATGRQLITCSTA